VTLDLTRENECVAIRVTVRHQGQIVALPDVDGRTFDAAGDFDRLLPMETQPPLRDTPDLPFFSRVEVYADVEFSSPEMPAIEHEARSLMPLATLGPEVRGPQWLSALARYGANLQGAVLHVQGD
jgi:hypothetical protein